MDQISDPVRKFFEDFQKGINTSDIDLLAALYGDTFMFANFKGAQAVKKEDFLKILPKRGEYFKAVGLISTTIRSFEETRIDDHYSMVRVTWIMRYEKNPDHPVSDENYATYVLHRQENSAQIVFQLDHQDLAQRAQDLGFAPGKS